MTWRETFRRLNKKTLMPPGYKADNRIFMTAVALVFFWLVLAATNLPSMNYHVVCPESSLQGCENPFYQFNCQMLMPLDKWVCDLEILPPGFELGQRPGFFYETAGLFAVLVMGGAVALNHFLYNKDFRMEGSE